MIKKLLLVLPFCFSIASAATLNDANKLLNSGNCVDAVKIYHAGAEKGIPYASFKLGLLHSSPSCLELDYLRAEQYYKTAAENGFKYAYANLGALYFGDEMPLSNNKKAYEAWMKAKELGVDTRLNLAILLYLGEGTAQNVAKAEQFLLDIIEENTIDAEAAKTLLRDFYSERGGALYSDTKLRELLNTDK